MKTTAISSNKRRRQIGAIRYISLFSGVECATLAVKPLGWTPVCFAEIEPFPCAVLAHRFPEVPNVGDMARHDWSQYRGCCDVVIGGSPCQAFSIAGRRQSLADERGNLTLSYVEAVNAIDPYFTVWENVPGVLSTKDNAFGSFLGALAGCLSPIVLPRGCKWPNAGMVAGPRRVIAWRILNAQFFGIPQRRRRIFLVGCPRSSGFDPAEILFECTGVCGHSSQSGKTGKGIAEPAAGGSGDGSRPKHASTGYARIAKRLTGRNQASETCVAYIVSTAHTRSNGSGVSEGIAYTLDQSPGQAVAFTQNQAGDVLTGDVAPSIGTNANATGRNTAKVLTANGEDAADAPQGVRRLTPRECERLQGIPDDHTLIPFRGRLAADGPRYKAIGNGMAVPCIGWVLQRIHNHFF